MTESLLDFFIQSAHAADAPPPQGPGASSLLFLAVFFIIFYFFLLRPQIKRSKEQSKMVEALEKGDEVVTTGGILGKILKVDSSFLDIEIAKGVVIKVQKNAVSSLMPKGTYQAN